MKFLITTLLVGITMILNPTKSHAERELITTSVGPTVPTQNGPCETTLNIYADYHLVQDENYSYVYYKVYDGLSFELTGCGYGIVLATGGSISQDATDHHVLDFTISGCTDNMGLNYNGCGYFNDPSTKGYLLNLINQYAVFIV